MFVFSDSEGTIKDTSFVKIFLMMHPWYISSTDLSKKLLLQYPLSTTPSGSKICHLVKYWISEFPVEFDLNPALADQIKDLRENLNTGGNETQSQLIDFCHLWLVHTGTNIARYYRRCLKPRD
uniref:N-terminal Ras-GEF domain-containing protein n=1 Tax=Sinocyclocheilus anshuiensis TaxID=1608454 RepID=A0A671KE58_9TELE